MPVWLVWLLGLVLFAVFGVILGVAVSGGLWAGLRVVGLCGLWWLACGWWGWLSGLLVVVIGVTASVFNSVVLFSFV